MYDKLRVIDDLSRIISPHVHRLPMIPEVKEALDERAAQKHKHHICVESTPFGPIVKVNSYNWDNATSRDYDNVYTDVTITTKMADAWIELLAEQALPIITERVADFDNVTRNRRIAKAAQTELDRIVTKYREISLM